MNPVTTQTLANERDPTLPPSLPDLILQWVRRASVSALGLSLLFHAILLLIAAKLIIGGGSYGGGGEAGSGPIEMAVVTEGELTHLQDQALGVQTPTVPEAPMKDMDVATQITDAGPAAVGGSSGTELGDIGSLAGGGDISMGGGQGMGLGGSGGGGASFFGVEAQGNRFAYLVDVSGSMGESLANNEVRKIEQLKAELTRSTQALLENSFFMIVRFSSDADVLGDKREWIEASPAGKKAFKTLIATLGPEGGTNPLPGFEMIFAMRPRPDAIYFMTDGEFDPSVVDELAAMNRNLKIPIHCIDLGSVAGQDNLKKIANGSKGTFRFIGGKP
jgi:von Willebrand factor type A domain